MPDVLVKTIDRDAGLRVIAAVTTDLVREAVRRNGATGLGACALGRALTSGLLLATLTKGGERVTVQIQCEGPLGGVTIDANDDGEVRGYVYKPQAAAVPCVGRARLVDVVGRVGIINVVRDLGLRERYAGQVPLCTGEIDEDVEAYLRTSEQVPSALGCEVVMDGHGAEICSAGGLLVQSLPGGSTDSVREVQHSLRTGELWETLRRAQEQLSPLDLARAVYARPLEALEERPLRFRCRCSRERVANSLTLLSTVDLDELVVEGQAEVTCNFCNERYVLGREELEEIRQVVARGPRERN